ncbi:MAG: low molecular weight protein arginine phosphatase [Nitrospinota bacterium]
MKHILIVCTGNICRSPMAAGLMRHALAERGVDGIEVISTGISALAGVPADPMVQEVLKPFGVDVSDHRGRMITEELIEWADRILVMTAEHRVFVEAMVPEASEKIRLLGAYGPGNDPERGIPDPYGGSAFQYRACVVELHEAIDGFLVLEGEALDG